MNGTLNHQYVDRQTGRLCNERLFADRTVRMLYGPARERAPLLYRALTGSRVSSLLATINFDLPFTRPANFMREMNIDAKECLDPPRRLNTIRKIFERKILYWDCRPMPDDAAAIVSPCDARLIVGSLAESSQFFIKEKFFDLPELIGREPWINAFQDGDFAVFRLTPDKYHYNHLPVSGLVVDSYEIDGAFHSCNPSASVSLVTPFSKNRRVVTIINTNVPGGPGLGLVAMVEVVALMIGEIVQCYSDEKYDNPRAVGPGLFVEKGQPKSLFRPGSSTVVLFFQTNRFIPAGDLVCNQLRPGAQSRLTRGFGRPLVETDVKVRSWIGFGKTRRVTEIGERPS